MIYNLKLSKRLQQYLKVFNNIRLRDMSVCISQLSAQILNLSTFHCTNGLPTHWPTKKHNYSKTRSNTARKNTVRH